MLRLKLQAGYLSKKHIIWTETCCMSCCVLHLDRSVVFEACFYYIHKYETHSPAVASCATAVSVWLVQGLSLVLSEGGMRDGEEKDHPMEEDSGDSELLQGYQWLLRDLPRLPLFDSVRATTALALQQVGGSSWREQCRACSFSASAETDLSKLDLAVILTGLCACRRVLLMLVLVFIKSWFLMKGILILGHPHGDRSPDHQCLPGVPLPACPSGGAGTAQRPCSGERRDCVGDTWHVPGRWKAWDLLYHQDEFWGVCHSNNCMFMSPVHELKGKTLVVGYILSCNQN